MLRPENGQDRKKQRIRAAISGGEKKMGRMRKSYAENFKRKVAIEAIREKKTVAEIATEYGVAPSLVTEWKQHFINGEDSLRELQRQYNSERPHQGLEYETPDAVREGDASLYREEISIEEW